MVTVLGVMLVEAVQLWDYWGSLYKVMLLWDYKKSCENSLSSIAWLMGVNAVTGFKVVTSCANMR